MSATRIVRIGLLLAALFVTAVPARAQEEMIFAMCNYGEYTFLCGADPDSIGAHAVTHGPWSVPMNLLSVSENGRLVAYQPYGDGRDSLYLANVDGSGTRAVFRSGRVRSLALSPDGSRIAYSTDAGAESVLYVVDVATGEQMKVLDYVPGWFWMDRSWPVWSADGTRLLINLNHGDTNAIYVTNADGSGDLRQVTFPVNVGESVSDIAADFSPVDSGHVAFLRQTFVRTEQGLQGTYAIYTVDIDEGGEPSLVYESHGTEQGGAIRYALQWSPDGTDIAFVRVEGPHPSRLALYTVPSSGGTPTLINSTDFAVGYWYERPIQWAKLGPGEIVVNDTRDRPDLDVSDEICDAFEDAGEQCTLRAAIQEANAREGEDEITFDIDEEGTVVIAPDSPLPTIAEAVEIDGSTQPGTQEVPLIRLDGAGAGGGSGLVVAADDVTIRGLIITGFGGHGIHVMEGDDGVLEGLIVGTDASGADGLGNGGDGIRLSGGKGWRVGSEEAPAGKTSSLSSLVTLAGNLQSGLCAIDPQNASRVLSQIAGAGGEPESTRLTLVGLVVGMVDGAVGAIARPNGAHGICLEGAVDTIIEKIRISDALANGVNIIASQSVDVQAATIGLRQDSPSSSGLIGTIRGSALRIAESMNVTIGSDDPSDAPVEGGGAEGWFVEVEDARDVQVRNVLAGITRIIEEHPDEVRGAMRNLSGGMSVTDSPNVTVGAPGVPTIFANNGGDESKPQAGFFATGEATRFLRAFNLHIGTTPEGLKGIGNLGDGFVLTDGVREALLGGETEDEQIVSAGNGGFGYLFRQLTAAAGVSPVQQVGSVLTANRLVSDMVRPSRDAISRIANQLSGFRLEEVEAVRMSQLSIGPALQNGLEVIKSIGVEIESASVGAFWSALIHGLDDIAGPEGDGVVIEESEDIALGRRLYEDYVASGYRFYVVGTGGRGLYAHQSARTRLANWAAGLSPEGSEESDEIFDALGSELEAMVIEESEDIDIENAAFMSSGEGASSGGGGLLISVSRRIDVINGIFGELLGEREARRQNAHAAIKALESEEVRIKASRLLKHAMGIVAEDSDLTLEGNTITLQGTGGGEGVGVQAVGEAVVQGARNVVTDNTGAGFWFTDGATGLIRHNDIEDNGQGVVVEATGNKSAGAASGEVLAPDNWWGDPSGPGGVGPGSGDAITEGVEVPTWRSNPVGVIVEPDARAVTGWAVTDVEIPVTFAHPMVGEDVLEVTVTDERGWVTSETSFEVPVTATSGARRVIEATLFDAGVNAVTIRAVSRTNPDRFGEAVVTIGSHRHFVTMQSAADAGTTVLDAEAEEAFIVGGEIVINPGGANEETANIAGFGSILLAQPLRFDHQAGELVVPANRVAVGVEDSPAPVSPESTTLLVYPNPAVDAVTFVLTLSQPGPARIELYDVLGRRVALLAAREAAPGAPLVLTADVGSLAPGTYFVRAAGKQFVATRQLMVIR